MKVIPAELLFVLVDENHSAASGKLAGRKCVLFLKRNGQCWGHSTDDSVAISELERLRTGSSPHLVFIGKPWWLDHYTAFHQLLDDNYRHVVDNECIIVFYLRNGLPVQTVCPQRWHDGFGCRESTRRLLPPVVAPRLWLRRSTHDKLPWLHEREDGSAR